MVWQVIFRFELTLCQTGLTTLWILFGASFLMKLGGLVSVLPRKVSHRAITFSVLSVCFAVIPSESTSVTGIDFMKSFYFEEVNLPERTYAVFETGKQKMPIPEYVELRKQIAAEWLENEEYQMINAPELAVYHWGIVGGCPERTIEIWIPIEKK